MNPKTDRVLARVIDDDEASILLNRLARITRAKEATNLVRVRKVKVQGVWLIIAVDQRAKRRRAA